ncbi:hypothetical protein Bint_0156 [Brachyspira intermedia PWS/A]|uniref:Uncharacterized protein n=1 Tax=Brachyspira intermedia (strain ATCC 51140 / PWS/A) TaxID=1045858 RepID=G0EPS6_BRAIP|nr:hypothetical protein [Brachyspira intermedia]AEM20790.1 hypothetical protein Bint_0156 [Brachyspira intermedia PWS/A]
MKKWIYITFLLISILFLILNILGRITRVGYLSDFQLDIQKTLELNNIKDVEDVESIYTNKNIKIYFYNYKLKYYNNIFKNNDIYDVYLYTNEVLSKNNFLKEINTENNGSTFGSFISYEIINSKSIDNIPYILKLKQTILYVFILFVFLLSFIIFVHNRNSLKIKIFNTLLLFVIFVILSKYVLKIYFINYIGIIFFILLYYFFIYYKNYHNSFSISNKKQYLILYMSAILFSIINIVILNCSFPLVGHDFTMIIPRAYSLLIYAKNNGIFSTEFASPLIGAGIISYANPQYDQYSIFYFVRYFLSFWDSYLLLTFLFSFIGFISFYYAVKDILKCPFIISLMSAALFLCTSYYMHHIAVGHWAFLYHPLTAFIVWLSFTDRFNYITRIVLSGLAFSMMIFGGAMQTIFFFTCFSLLGIASILFKPNKKFIYQCISILLSVSLGIILSLSKFIQAIYFGSKIDRGPYGLYINDVKLLLSNILHIFIYPFYNLININSFLTNSNMRINIDHQYIGEVWEADLGLPAVVFIFGLFMMINLLKNYFSKKSLINFINKYKFNLIFILIFIYLYCDIFFGDGLTRSVFNTLKAVNIHLRMSSVLIIPFLFVFALLIKNINIKNTYKNIIIIFIIISSVLLYVQKFIYIKEHNNAYINVNIRDDKTIFKNIKLNHNQYRVFYINNKKEFLNLKDFITTTNLNTSRLPYESIYGYSLETFKPKEEGSPYKIINGEYNFTDPRSLIFFNDEYPQFSGFATNDKNTLDNFLSFQSVNWKIPKMFTISNYISVISHIIIFLFLVFSIFYYLLKRKK